MRLRCPNAKPIGTAEIKDYELLFKGSKTGSYLTIEKKKGSTVPVGVWEVSKWDERALDRYEGYPSFYYKKSINIEVEMFKSGKAEKVRAFVYIMHEDRPIGIPTDTYLTTCLIGYGDFGFEPRPLETAVRESIRGCFGKGAI